MRSLGFHFLFLAFLVLFHSKSIAQTKPGTSAEGLYAADGYKLIWADEFNNDGTPDSANWRFEKGFVRNEEDQWYQEENAFCKNGLLVIEGRKESRPNPLYKAGSENWKQKRSQILYTSSSINTSHQHSWQYGRFVMRGRIDISSGLWPAWWTLGVNGLWPANGEIDIMEYYRKKTPGEYCLRRKRWKSRMVQQ